MEIIVFILVVIFALVSAGDRKKKAAKQAQNRANPGEAAGKAVAPGRSAAQMSMAERQERLAELKQKRAERASQKAARPSGSSERPMSAKASRTSSTCPAAASLARRALAISAFTVRFTSFFTLLMRRTRLMSSAERSAPMATSSRCTSS